MRALFFLSVLLARAAFSAENPAGRAADDLSALGMKVSVTIVFDTSGSMGDRHKLDMAKQAFGWWLGNAPKQTIVKWSLWVFDPKNERGLNLVDRKPNAAEEVQARINGLTAKGRTPLGRTLQVVTRIIDGENRRALEGREDILRQVVLIFTDGEDSFLPGNKVQPIIKRLRDVGAEVFSIGYQGEGGYLARVSDKFMMVQDEKQLKSGLSEFTYFIEKAGPSQ